MKLSLSIFVTYSSAQRCEDFTLGQRCQSSCDGDFYNCKDACDNGDFSCVTRCQAELLDCQSACPCGANCPQGCSTSDACGANEFCSYTSILVLNHKQHFRDQALAINTLDDSVSEVVFDYGLSDIEDACSVIFRGESYFLGGYQRTRQVAKIGGNGCEIEILDDRLSVGHQDGVFGSCSVFNQQVALCFAVENEDSKTCYSWEPGMRQSQLPTANESHDWSEMVTFRGSLFTVGGCLEPTYAGCHSKSEILEVGSDNWTYGTDFPISPLRGQMMTSDDQFVYVMAGRTIGGDTSLIPGAYKYDVSAAIWTEMGSLIQRSNWLNSVTQFNSSWYAGYCAMEKATLDENGMIDSEIILPDNNNCYMELYYATFVEIPAGQCQA